MTDGEIHRELVTAPEGERRTALEAELAERKRARRAAMGSQTGALGGFPGGHREATVPER
jgi:hypothetical protein